MTAKKATRASITVQVTLSSGCNFTVPSSELLAMQFNSVVFSNSVPFLKDDKQNSVPLKEKIYIYRSYIRPILTYACPVFANAAKTHIQKLQVAQNKNLRMALSARYCTRIHLLHERSNIPLIREYISKLTENFYKKSATSVNSLVSRLGEYSHRTPFPRLKHKLPRPSF
jgi:hypothetical protein